MAKNKDAIYVPGSWDISAGPVGTAEPADQSVALDAAFVGLGHTSEAGIGFSPNTETQTIRTSQSNHPVREVVTGYTTEVTFVLDEWNKDALEVALGATITEPVADSGNFKIEPAHDGTLTERAYVLDIADGDNALRRVIRRAVVTDVSEISVRKGEMMNLGVTLLVLGDEGVAPWYDLTNLAAVDPA